MNKGELPFPHEKNLTNAWLNQKSQSITEMISSAKICLAQMIDAGDPSRFMLQSDIDLLEQNSLFLTELDFELFDRINDTDALAKLDSLNNDLHNELSGKIAMLDSVNQSGLSMRNIDAMNRQIFITDNKIKLIEELKEVISPAIDN